MAQLGSEDALVFFGRSTRQFSALPAGVQNESRCFATENCFLELGSCRLKNFSYVWGKVTVLKTRQRWARLSGPARLTLFGEQPLPLALPAVQAPAGFFRVFFKLERAQRSRGRRQRPGRRGDPTPSLPFPLPPRPGARPGPPAAPPPHTRAARLRLGCRPERPIQRSRPPSPPLTGASSSSSAMAARPQRALPGGAGALPLPQPPRPSARGPPCCGAAERLGRPGPASSRSSPPAAALPGGFSVPAPLPRPSPPRWARCPARRSRTERRRGGLRRCRPALPLRSPLETHRRGARPGVPERAGFSEETAAQPARRYCGLGRGEGRLAFRVSAAAGAQRRLQASLARPASYSAAFDVRKQTPQSVRL